MSSQGVGLGAEPEDVGRALGRSTFARIWHCMLNVLDPSLGLFTDTHCHRMLRMRRMANEDGEVEQDRDESTEASGGFSEARAEAHLAEESDSSAARSSMSDAGSNVADSLGEKGRQDGTWVESRAEDEEQKQLWSAKADGLQGASDGDGDQDEEDEDTWC